MAEKSKPPSESAEVAAEAKVTDAVNAKATSTPQRKIPGNLPYVTASGTLKRALERSIEASRPDKFNADFLENVLKLSGGGARATIPILKRLGFLSSEGVPTELYAKFRTAGGRGLATLQALRIGFPEIFKKSEYAHTVDDNKLRDIILEITGLKANDPVAIAIKSTFSAIKSFIPPGMEASPIEQDAPMNDEGNSSQSSYASGETSTNHDNSGIRLAYNINIVLPETSDLKVLNAIFRSIKENLLR
ncbi:MAG: DUF5343 domain-containing protein [Polynucleobacter sp.]|nr:DUF5343 domain-containing protein [Polynucleobacter sp.]